MDFKIASIKRSTEKRGVIITGGKDAAKKIISGFICGNLFETPSNLTTTIAKREETPTQDIASKIRDTLREVSENSPETMRVLGEQKFSSKKEANSAAVRFGFHLAETKNSKEKSLLEKIISALDENNCYCRNETFEYEALGTPFFKKGLTIIPVPGTDKYAMTFMTNAGRTNIKEIADFFGFQQAIKQECISLELIPQHKKISLDWSDITSIFSKLPGVSVSIPAMRDRSMDGETFIASWEYFKINVSFSAAIDTFDISTQGTQFTAPLQENFDFPEIPPALFLNITDEHPESMLEFVYADIPYRTQKEPYIHGERASLLDQFINKIIRAFNPYIKNEHKKISEFIIDVTPNNQSPKI